MGVDRKAIPDYFKTTLSSFGIGYSEEDTERLLACVDGLLDTILPGDYLRSSRILSSFISQIYLKGKVHPNTLAEGERFAKKLKDRIE